MTVTTPDSAGSVEALRPVLAYLRDLHQWLDWAPVSVCPVRDPVEGLKCDRAMFAQASERAALAVAGRQHWGPVPDEGK